MPAVAGISSPAGGCCAPSALLRRLRPCWRDAAKAAAVAVAGFLAVLGALAGCSGQPPVSSPPKSSPLSGLPAPTASNVSPSSDPRVLARQAYLGMWHTYVAAARTADYQAPGLDHYAAGGALSTLTSGLYQEHQEGEVSLGQPVLHPVVTMAKRSGGVASQASVTDCADSSHWMDYHDGKPVAGQDLGRRHIVATLQPFNGTWKVTYLNVGKAGTC